MFQQQFLLEYVTVSLSAVFLVYLFILIIEIKYKKRLAPVFRSKIDKNLENISNIINKKSSFLKKKIAKSNDAIGGDLIDPISSKVLKTYDAYKTIKTGKKEIKEAKKKDISKHLKKLSKK